MSARCPRCNEEMGDCLCPRAAYRPMRRNSDPGPSHDAAREIVGHLGALKRKAVEAIRNHPRKTCQELADLEQMRDPRTLNRRISELATAGVILPAGERRCTVTNRNAQTWVVPAARDQGLF